MQLIYSPTLPPGCCFICRGAVRDSYIDTAVSKDYEGAFYICNMCVNEMAKMYSYLRADEYKDLRVQKEELESQVYVLIKRVGELEEIDRALVAAGYKRNADGDFVRSGGYSITSDEGTRIQLLESESQLGAGKGTIIEQSDDPELAGVQSSEQSSSDESEFKLEF